MHPILFQWGPVTIYSYGLLLALAFLACGLVVLHEAKYRGLKADIVYDLIILAAVGGIVGARVFYVAAHWVEFSFNYWEIFAIQNGGLVFYGGLFGGTLTVLSYIWWKRLPLAQIADLVALVLPLGAAIGRLGCFLNGCCYGKITFAPLGVVFPGLGVMARHPTQLYDSLYNLLLFVLLWFLRHRLPYAGMLFWTYLTVYSVARFTIEFWRENIPFLWGLSGNQLISIAVFALSLIALVVTYFYSQRRSLNDVVSEDGAELPSESK